MIGITGGIASGKSTVSVFLREKGYVVIDADEVVRSLQQKGRPLYQALVAAFGQEILAADGQLDRPKLSQLLFSDKDLLDQSAQVQNTIIREELAKQRQDFMETESLLFMEIPLLFELGYEDWCAEVWLVAVDEAIQIQRLVSRNGYTQEEARQRLVAQLPLAEKKAKAHRVIDNQGSLEATQKQVEGFLAELVEKMKEEPCA